MLSISSNSSFPSMSRLRLPASLLLLCAILPLIAGTQLVTAQTTCDGTSGGGTGVLTRTDALGSTSFTVNPGCVGITLDGCTADDVTFPVLSGSVAVVIKNLDCGTVTSPGSCITFSSTVSGGSVDINGLTRTVSGTAAGEYSMVKFGGAVSGVSGISIKGIVLTLDRLSTAGDTDVWLVYAASTVTGDSSANSAFNVSECEVTSGSSLTTSSGYARLHLSYTAGHSSGFETYEASGNRLEGLSLTAAAWRTYVLLIFPEGGITLTGTANAAIIMRGNSMKGSSTVSTSSGQAQIILFHSPWGSAKNIAGVSSIIVDGADMRDCTVTAASRQWARLMVLYFTSIPTLTMVKDGKISINNAWLGGEMTYGKTDIHGYGAKILQLFSSSTTGIKEISTTNCLIDMSSNNGIQASGGSVAAIAHILDFKNTLSGLTSLTARNCSIRGTYSSAASTVDLHILRAANTLSATTVSITDSEVATATAVIESGPVQFVGAVSSSNIIVKSLGCGDVMKPTSICVYFASTITGGSVDIDGLRRTVSGSTPGDYFVIKFDDAVSGVSSMSVKSVSLTLDSVTTSSASSAHIFFGASTVAGSGSQGSALNVSGCEVVSGSSLTTRSGYSAVDVLRAQGLISGFETVEASGNKVGVSVTAGSQAEVILMYAYSGWTLTGTANAAIILRSNSMRGSSAVAPNHWAAVHLMHGPFSSDHVQSGVSNIIVDGADMRDCTVTAASAGKYAQIVVLFFFSSPTLTMVNSGKISINNAWIGGEMTYSATDTNGCGARILNLYSRTSGIKEISTTNCLIDMSKNNGIQASGASVGAFASVLHLNDALSGLNSIAATNCSIRGKYGSAASSVDLHMLYAANTLSATTVSITDSEVATATAVIENGPVQFVGAVSSSNIIVKSLGCGDVMKPTSKCVNFASTMTGGSIDIDGLRRTVSGSTAGTYNIVRFVGAVSGVSGTAVKGIVLTLDSLSSAGNTAVFFVYAASSIAGDGSVGSSFNVSECEVTSASSLTTSSGVARMWTVSISGAISGFETLEASGNRMAGVALSGSGVELSVLIPRGGLTLIGTASSAIVMRSNSMKGSSAVSTDSGFAQMVLLSGPWESAKNIAGVSSIIVDGADMRDCSVTAASGQWARLMVLAFLPPSTLTLVNSGKITIHNAWIGGEITVGLTKNDGYGANIFNLFTTSSGIKEISATNSFIDMSKNNGLEASGASVVAMARVLDINSALGGLTSITASNCSIRGKYSSAASSTEIQILRAASPLASPTSITITDNTIHASSATAAQKVEAFIAHFKGSVTGAAGGSDTFDVSGSVVRGDYTSSGSSVCAGIAVFDTPAFLLTGFEVIDRNAGIDINAQEAAPFGGTHGYDSIIVRCGNNVTSTTTTAEPTSSSTTTTTSSTTTTSTSASTTTIAETTATNATDAHETSVADATGTDESPLNTTTPTNTTEAAETTTTTTTSRPRREQTKSQSAPAPTTTSGAPLEIPQVFVGAASVVDSVAIMAPAVTAGVSALASSAAGAVGSSAKGLRGATSAAFMMKKMTAASAMTQSCPILAPAALQPLSADNNAFSLALGPGPLATWRGAVASCLLVVGITAGGSTIVLGIVYCWKLSKQNSANNSNNNDNNENDAEESLLHGDIPPQREKSPLQKAIETLRFPSIMGTSFQIMASSAATAVGGIAYLLSTDGESGQNAAFVAVGIVLLILFPVVAMVLICVKTNKDVGLEAQQTPKDPGPLRKFFWWLMMSEDEYEGTYFMNAMGFCISDSYLPGWPVLLLATADLLSAVVPSLISGVSTACLTDGCCIGTAAAALVYVIMHFSLLLSLHLCLGGRCYFHKIETMLSFSGSFLALACSGLIIVARVSRFGDDHLTLVVAGTLSDIGQYIGMTALFVTCVMPCIQLVYDALVTVKDETRQQLHDMGLGFPLGDDADSASAAAAGESGERPRGRVGSGRDRNEAAVVSMPVHDQQQQRRRQTPRAMSSSGTGRRRQAEQLDDEDDDDQELHEHHHRTTTNSSSRLRGDKHSHSLPPPPSAAAAAPRASSPSSSPRRQEYTNVRDFGQKEHQKVIKEKRDARSQRFSPRWHEYEDDGDEDAMQMLARPSPSSRRENRHQWQPKHHDHNHNHHQKQQREDRQDRQIQRQSHSGDYEQQMSSPRRDSQRHQQQQQQQRTTSSSRPRPSSPSSHHQSAGAASGGDRRHSRSHQHQHHHNYPHYEDDDDERKKRPASRSRRYDDRGRYDDHQQEHRPSSRSHHQQNDLSRSLHRDIDRRQSRPSSRHHDQQRDDSPSRRYHDHYYGSGRGEKDMKRSLAATGAPPASTSPPPPSKLSRREQKQQYLVAAQQREQQRREREQQEIAREEAMVAHLAEEERKMRARGLVPPASPPESTEELRRRLQQAIVETH